MIIRTNSTNDKYQYSKYKVGDVFEVINDFGEYYTAKFISGSDFGTVVAVCKSDCEEVVIGSDPDSREVWMTTDD
tara:strand:- start:589 stop:813 length:225 start_codon:yes stop_codon:yes gene_type:complete